MSSAGSHGLLLLRPAPEHRSISLGLDAILKKLEVPGSYSIDIILKELGLSTGYGIDLRLYDLSVRTNEIDITALLKGLSIAELCEVDVALRRLTLTNNYHNDVLVILRSQVSLAIDAAVRGLSLAAYAIDVSISLIPRMPQSVSIGVYILSHQKFDITVSFEQFTADPTFEYFEIGSSFESPFTITPYFQEV